MSDRFDERLLDYLEGRISEEARDEIEQEIAGSPSLAAELEQARRGLEALRGLGSVATSPVPPLAAAAWESLRSAGDVPETPASPVGSRRTFPPGFRRAATIAALFLLPASGWFARGLVAPPGSDGSGQLPVPGVATPALPNVEMQQYLLLFTGPWSDMETLSPQERIERQEAYMTWIGWLEEEGRYVAGAELGGDPGIFMASSGMGVTEFQPDLPTEEYIVGFVYFRAENAEEARRIAAECPHVRYGSGVLLKGADGMAM